MGWGDGFSYSLNKTDFSGLADSRVFCIQGSLDTSRDVLHEDVTVTSCCGKVYN